MSAILQYLNEFSTPTVDCLGENIYTHIYIYICLVRRRFSRYILLQRAFSEALGFADFPDTKALQLCEVRSCCEAARNRNPTNPHALIARSSATPPFRPLPSCYHKANPDPFRLFSSSGVSFTKTVCSLVSLQQLKLMGMRNF